MPISKPNSSRRIGWRRLALLGSSLLLLTGCQTLSIGTPRYIDTSCEVFSTITYSSKHDTPETIAQVKKHNRKYQSLCS